jgi:hypothetical protein
VFRALSSASSYGVALNHCGISISQIVLIAAVGPSFVPRISLRSGERNSQSPPTMASSQIGVVGASRGRLV